MVVDVVVVVVVAGELCPKQTPNRPQVNATRARMRIFMGRELEEFSTG